MSRPKILIVNTTWWPLAARLADSFLNNGAAVSALVPCDHPIQAIKGVRLYRYAGLKPLTSLRVAIESERPDIIVPADDRATQHLHQLHSKATQWGKRGAALCALIRRSLGDAHYFPLCGSRTPFLEYMSAAGVRVPDGAALNSETDLKAWFLKRPGKAVIKAEGSWGGSGVRIVDNFAEALAAYRDLCQPLPFRRMLRILLVDRNSFVLSDYFYQTSPRISIQAYVEGRRANVMALAWRGKLVTSVSVEVMAAQSGTGAATILRRILSDEMTHATEQVAEKLGMSGFFGLDFMIEEETGRAFMIEMNPRATQLGHLSFGSKTLTQALVDTLQGKEVSSKIVQTRVWPMAMFPQALRFPDEIPLKVVALLDVPWSRPELVKELLREPRSRRGLLARFEMWCRHHPAFGNPIRPELFKQLNAILSVPGKHEVTIWKNGLIFELCDVVSKPIIAQVRKVI
ncbi:ATP-grasp domain-containing protein [Kozakia baliensis]|uniref:ATP-grasp domain-containing protein n=1 Tax=Kozakia baliensis TaxID=153496 RepID=UPI00345BACDC